LIERAGALEFARDLESPSDGEIRVEFIGDNQICGQVSCVEKCQQDTVDIYAASTQNSAGGAPYLNVLDYACQFRSRADQYHFLYHPETPIEDHSITSMFVVEGFTVKDIPSVVVRSAQITGILAPLIAASVVMQQILSLLGAQEVIGGFVTGMGGYYPVLFTAMGIVFVAGMIHESLPVTIILAPILAPIAASVGVDPVHFAVIFLVGASIGFIAPPYGLNLYVASGVTGVPYFRLLRYSTMYLIALITVWIAVAMIPDLALFLLPDR
jgi:hypothetical protein